MKNKDIIKNHIKNGVIFRCLDGVYIGPQAGIESGVEIYQNNIITGKSVIKKGAVIGKGNTITDSVVGESCVITDSVITGSVIGAGVTVGPFAHIRPGSVIGGNCRIGDFVEIKNSSIGDGTKVSHLTYIGDSDLGSGINIGCGVVFVNYDGKEKHRSEVGDGAFIGCNVNIISPAKIGAGAYLAAGSTVAGEVPAGALFIERGEGEIKEGWVERRGLLKKEK